MSGDNYIRFSGELMARTVRAVNIDNLWIARACIHGADERNIDKHDIGDEIELRVFSWLAEREGLL